MGYFFKRLLAMFSVGNSIFLLAKGDEIIQSATLRATLFFIGWAGGWIAYEQIVRGNFARELLDRGRVR